jgi:hypothetical protein
MKHAQDFFLQFRFEVNQQVAAADQVDFGKRRVVDQVMDRKNEVVADAFFDVIRAVPVIEKRERR